MSTEHADSNTIAARFHVSQRHARRMIKTNDPRLHGVDRSYLLKRSRERLGAECQSRSTAVDDIARALSMAPNTETFREGPEINRLKAICRRLTKIAVELRALGAEISQPEE